LVAISTLPTTASLGGYINWEDFKEFLDYKYSKNWSIMVFLYSRKYFDRARELTSAIFNGVIYGVIIWPIFTTLKKAGIIEKE